MGQNSGSEWPMKTQEETPTLERTTPPGVWDTFSLQPGNSTSFKMAAWSMVKLWYYIMPTSQWGLGDVCSHTSLVYSLLTFWFFLVQFLCEVWRRNRPSLSHDYTGGVIVDFFSASLRELACWLSRNNCHCSSRKLGQSYIFRYQKIFLS